MENQLHKSWHDTLSDEFQKEYFFRLKEFIYNAYQTTEIYPAQENIFRAFSLTPFDKVKIVIIGQDPYHEPSQANGLAFSVGEGVKFPPSLVNIFKELSTDIGVDIPTTGSLDHWANQGVLLVNATLSVEAHKAGSHQKKGWERFTDAVIAKIASEKTNIVFILWGAYAQKKGAFIDENKHLVIRSAHPSPLSSYRGFFGSKPFSKANAYLKEQGLSEINWG